MRNRISVYVAGCILFSIGAKFFINSNLGVDPLDCMVIGLANKLGTKIGTISSGVAIIFLAIWSIWNKRKPLLTPFITMAFVGYLIDLWNFLIIKPNQLTHIYTSYELLIVGLIVCSFASSLIIMSGIGIRTMDLIAITLVEKKGLPFFLAKGAIELFFIITGIVLEGPIGVGTIFFLLIVGPLIKPFIILNTKLFHISDYGLSVPNAIV